MGNHCPGCGAVHEEDDDRKCSECAQKSSFFAQKLDREEADWIATRARMVVGDINTWLFNGSLGLNKSEAMRVAVERALKAAANYRDDRRKVCGESPIASAALAATVRKEGT